jgi:hypothetical protein
VGGPPGPRLVAEAVAVGRAHLAGGAHSDASWSVREVDGHLVRWDVHDGDDEVVEVDLAEVRRLAEVHGASIVRWRPALVPLDRASVPEGAEPSGWPVADEVPWSWSLHRGPDEQVALVVVCGSVGIYERTVLLDDDLVQAHRRHGRRLLEVLAAEVRASR